MSQVIRHMHRHQECEYQDAPLYNETLNIGQVHMTQKFVNPSRMTVVLAYVIGLAYWVTYFVKESPTFTGNDWLKEQVFSNLIRESIETLQVPWRMSLDFYHAGVHELIANPEVSLAPDMLLLGVLPNNIYFLVHWLLFFTLGFIGTVMLARKYQLSNVSFLFFVVLFNFNGFIGSHVSEGHIQWAGYFLFPFFFCWLPDLGGDHERDKKRSALKIALLFGFMFLNGSFHMAIWCLMLLALMLIYRQDLWRHVGLLILLAGLMGVARLLPAAIYFPAKTDFVSGYPTISTLLDAFTFVYHPENPARGGSFGNLAWHEYSFYVGYIGFVFLIAGVYAYARQRLRFVPVWWFPAAIIMFMFSMGDVYQIIPNSGVPFSTIERVPSRFIVMPFCVLLLVAALGFTHLEQRYLKYTRLILTVSLFPMLGEIFQNARKWRIQSYESAIGVNQIPLVSIVESHDQLLRVVVVASWSVSLVAAVVSIFWLVRLHKD